MNNKYPALTASQQEPEYKVNPSLKISSVGTEIKKNSSQMPFGSAILTDTGSSQLNSNGITHVIHAALMPQGNDEELFIEKAVLAMQNSIILADRQGFKKLATCFLAGGIYCNKESTKPLLAEALIWGALSQLKECQNLEEVIFVDFDADYLKDAMNRIERDANCPENSTQARIEKGDKTKNLLHQSLHGANVIVNSENAGMGWGGGISGAISNALGSEASNVDKQRKYLMKEFNELINGQQQEDNNPKEHTFVAWLKGFQDLATEKGGEYGELTKYVFEIKNSSKLIMVSYHHPAFKNINMAPMDGSVDRRNIWHKIKLKDKDVNNDLNCISQIKKSDFFEIEEIKREEISNQNDNHNHSQDSPTKKDNGQSPDEQNEDNDKNDDNSQKPSNRNGSNDNNSDKKKNKTPSTPNIPDSVKEYFTKNKVKSIELEGENWIITYKDKKEKKTISTADISKLQGLESYLKSQGKKFITAEEVEKDSSANSSASKGNETKYWPWILGGGGILVIGMVTWAVRKNRKKSK